jgi:hypothetical protein
VLSGKFVNLRISLAVNPNLVKCLATWRIRCPYLSASIPKHSMARGATLGSLIILLMLKPLMPAFITGVLCACVYYRCLHLQVSTCSRGGSELSFTVSFCFYNQSV